MSESNGSAEIPPLSPNSKESTEVKTSTEVDLDVMDDPGLLKYESVLKRYYTPMYRLSLNNKPIEHHCILFHSNRICLLTLAKSHPIIKHRKGISRINCNVTGDLDRMKNKVVGKGKRGGQKLLPDAILCQIECDDGESYNVYSCIKGKLIEINENLVERPDLLIEYPQTKGHIAVLLSDLSTVEMCKKDMLSENLYQEEISRNENVVN